MGKKEGGKEKQKSKSTSLPPGQRAPSASGDGGDMNGTADFINNLSTYEVEERFEQMLVRKFSFIQYCTAPQNSFGSRI